ncbi:hypothetical protein BBI15_04565 [Planococcus plakortidis]|uniref:YpoC-like domain-containing protein n=1 Tax=Planococcus plakortidis TaxID=1038856 RepID=A0A1C7E7U4_9BACL|nr:hypothetical protein [Planococcus plakortidis]ANU19527.1 hypothetical protein BBI15_04565 [Planococcus plakortidis]
MMPSRKSIDQAVSPFYEDWAALSQAINACFGEGTGDCRKLIAEGWQLYEALKQALHGLFGDSAPCPLNEGERLAFVKNSRSAHAASRQLEQLFGELKKKIARTKISYPAE